MLRDKCLGVLFGLVLCGGVSLTKSAIACPPWCAGCCPQPAAEARCTDECTSEPTTVDPTLSKATEPEPTTSAPKPASPVLGPTLPAAKPTPPAQKRTNVAQRPTPEKVSLHTAKPAAHKPVMVMIGSTQCFWLRAADGAESPQRRSDRITDVFNKYLGGSKATFAVKPVGQKTVIFMNGDLTLTVTPEDVKAANAKSLAALTASWKGALVKAFEETKAIK